MGAEITASLALKLALILGLARSRKVHGSRIKSEQVDNCASLAPASLAQNWDKNDQKRKKSSELTTYTRGWYSNKCSLAS
jgi:hypothetical protein